MSQVRIKFDALIKAEQKLTNLRNYILNDPDLSKIPSVKKSTQYVYHASVDHPKIKYLLFEALQDIEFSFITIIRRKDKLTAIANHIKDSGATKLTINQIYQDSILELFYNNIHKQKHIYFAFSKRGNVASQEFPYTLKNVEKLTQARFQRKRWDMLKVENFAKRTIVKFDTSKTFLQQNNLIHKHKIHITGLEIVDYTMWALQRGLEKNEWGFYEKIKNKSAKIIDFDKKRWFNRKDCIMTNWQE